MVEIKSKLAMKGGRFCSLEYRPFAEKSQAISFPSCVLMLMLEDCDGCFEIFVSPNLSVLVHHDHLHYMKSLLEDFNERVRLDPSSLFRQLSSLSVGLLITHKIGTCGVDDEYLNSTCSGFVPAAEARNGAITSSESL